MIPSFSSPDLFAAWEEEHEPAPAARAAWFSPGGFQAFEHFWALPEAIRFHQNIGPARITARTHELNAQMKEGLADMPRVQLYTPRDEKDRVLLIVDGVHGLGVENPKITALGCDAFAAGTHKWLFGPRGTGFVWAKPEVWKRMRPVIPSFSSPDLFAAWEEEHEPASAARAAWFSPGGFQAFEHFWALPEAIRFHQNIGSARITARTHELNAQMKEGLAGMPRVQLYTPRDENLSAGMVCFDVKGTKPEAVVERLLAQRIVASTTPYRVSYGRVACSIVNTPQEVETVLRAIRELA